LVFGMFVLALLIDFTLIAGYTAYLEGSRLSAKVRRSLVPLLPSELASALLAVGTAYLYVKIGLATVALLAIALLTFQYMTAALLHDIGKFVLPDRILKGDQDLTESDWEEIKKHPYEGARIVSQIDGYQPVSEIVLAHHERIDGLGYPRGLPSDHIPIGARII